MEKVSYFFTAEMASVIQQIPVSRHDGEDFISWPHARFGNYTVRSAYNLARTESFFASRSTKVRGDYLDLAG
jgi:hypothetical protein